MHHPHHSNQRGYSQIPPQQVQYAPMGYSNSPHYGAMQQHHKAPNTMVSHPQQGMVYANHNHRHQQPAGGCMTVDKFCGCASLKRGVVWIAALDVFAAIMLMCAACMWTWAMSGIYWGSISIVFCVAAGICLFALSSYKTADGGLATVAMICHAFLVFLNFSAFCWCVVYLWLGAEMHHVGWIDLFGDYWSSYSYALIFATILTFVYSFLMFHAVQVFSSWRREIRAGLVY